MNNIEKYNDEIEELNKEFENLMKDPQIQKIVDRKRHSMIDDISLLNELAKCLYGYPTQYEKKTLYTKILALLEENNRFRKWDVNKDTRNSRQRIANKKLTIENKMLKDELFKVYNMVNNLTEGNAVELDAYLIIHYLEDLIGGKDESDRS
jgi:hypothetical protein